MPVDGAAGRFSISYMKVVRGDGTQLDLAHAAIRYVGYLLAALPLGIGLIWAFFDPFQQGWHDRIAGSLVTSVERDVRARTLARSAVALLAWALILAGTTVFAGTSVGRTLDPVETAAPASPTPTFAAIPVRTPAPTVCTVAAATTPMRTPTPSVPARLIEVDDLEVLRARARAWTEHVSDSRTVRMSHYPSALQVRGECVGASDGSDLSLYWGAHATISFADGIRGVGFTYQQGLWSSTFEVKLKDGSSALFYGTGFYPEEYFFGVYSDAGIESLTVRTTKVEIGGGSFSLRRFYFFADGQHPRVFR